MIGPPCLGTENPARGQSRVPWAPSQLNDAKPAEIAAWATGRVDPDSPLSPTDNRSRLLSTCGGNRGSSTIGCICVSLRVAPMALRSTPNRRPWSPIRSGRPAPHCASVATGGLRGRLSCVDRLRRLGWLR
jgi:hypothetical protein